MATADVRIIGSWDDSDEGPAQGTVYFQRHDTIQSYATGMTGNQVERTTLDSSGSIDTTVVGADPDDPNPLAKAYRVIERIVGTRAAVVYDIEVTADSGTIDLSTVARLEAPPTAIPLYASLAALAAETADRIAADADLQEQIATAAAAAQAFAIQRGNHTGTQAQSTVANLTTDLAGKVPTTRQVAGKPLSADVTLVKGDVGLGNADNTSDASKAATEATAVRTLTNKRVVPRVLAIASSATPAIDVDAYDRVNITALATAVTSMTSGLTGTPTPFQSLVMRIKDDGTTRAITWGASFVNRGATMPTATTAGKVHMVGFFWNSNTSTWDCHAATVEA